MLHAYILALLFSASSYPLHPFVPGGVGAAAAVCETEENGMVSSPTGTHESCCARGNDAWIAWIAWDWDWDWDWEWEWEWEWYHIATAKKILSKASFSSG